MSAGLIALLLWGEREALRLAEEAIVSTTPTTSAPQLPSAPPLRWAEMDEASTNASSQLLWTCYRQPESSFLANSNYSISWSTCPVRVMEALIPALLSLVTVVGNFLVLVAVAKSPKLSRKLTSVLICNLASADLLVGLVVMPLAVSQIVTSGFWAFPRLICRIWISLDVICCTASIVTLCIISLDRFFGVLYPMQYQVVVTRKKLIVTAGFIWLFSIVVLLITVRYQKTEESKSREYICHVSDELRYVTHSVVLSFFVPLCVILFVYWKIYKVTKKRELSLIQSMVYSMKAAEKKEAADRKAASRSVHYANGVSTDDASSRRPTGDSLASDGDSRRKSRIPSLFQGGITFPGLRMHYGTSSNAGKESQADKKRRFYLKHKKSAKTLGIVVGVFLLCWLPFFLLYLIDHFTSAVPVILLEIFTWLGYSNSAMNPVIYSITVKAFRQAFIELLSCAGRQAKPRTDSAWFNRSRTFFGQTEGAEGQRDSNSRVLSTLRNLRRSIRRLSGPTGAALRRRGGLADEESSGSSASVVASFPASSKASVGRRLEVRQPAEEELLLPRVSVPQSSSWCNLKLYQLLVGDKETHV